ncbi:MAG: glutamine-hydrolyzing carbamoyl-phosphate synthase small subunit [Thermoleophilia bacterium]|nr:glutamine-hydrolyzing carbamoyl-phosphate synthase small subunit [Thermoleophilia bacterium]
MHRGEVPGYVVLKDGTVFSGFGFAAQGRVLGEVVFNTSLSGYQEVVTDPSYHGQMVTFTYPMIGNYGASDHLLESPQAYSRAIIVREAKNTAWNATCSEGWVDWLTARGVVGVGGIDTRALTRRIREHGAMTACVAAGPDLEVGDLLEAARGFPDMAGRDLAGAVTCDAPYEWPSALGAPTPAAPGVSPWQGPAEGGQGTRFRVVAYDFGIKRSILRSLAAIGCQVTVVPAWWTAEQTFELRPDGVFLSNGPGDPAAVGYAVETIRGLLGEVPVFGICLGHQLLALALGFSTYKLKFGHRGANHPVRDYLSGRVEITSQNHGFAVEPPEVVRDALQRGAVVGVGSVAGLEAGDMLLESEFGPAQVTHLNLNDGTVEGLRLLDLPVYSVQYHPEAGPGPHDSQYLFRKFGDLMLENAGTRAGKPTGAG